MHEEYRQQEKSCREVECRQQESDQHEQEVSHMHKESQPPGSSLTGRKSLVGRRNLVSRRLACWTLAVLLVCQIVQTYRLVHLRYKLRILHLNQLL